MTSEKQRRNSILITRHYPDLGCASDWSCRVGNLIQPSSDASSVWNFSDFIWRGNQWLRCQMSAVVSGCFYTIFCRKNFVTKTLCWQVTFILTITRTFKFFNLPIWGRSESLQSWALLTLYFLPPWWRIFIHYNHKKKKTNQGVSEITKCLPLT